MEDVSILSLLGRLVVSMAVVIALMAAAARLARKRAGGLGGRISSRAAVEVLARHSLGRTASVAVVRAGGRVLVLGVTESAVQLLTEADPSAVEDDTQDGPEADWTALPGGPMGSGQAWRGMIEQMRERTVRRT